MPFCRKCGTRMETDDSFCPSCGTAVLNSNASNDNAPIQPTTEARPEPRKERTPGSFRCPQCQNDNLQVINESNTTTTGSNFSGTDACCGYILFGPLGILCGLCGANQQTTTTNTQYFICSKCGSKFRTPASLREEAQKARSGSVGGVIAALAISIVFSIILMCALEGHEIAVMVSLITVGISVLIGGIGFFISRDRADKLEATAEEIESKLQGRR